MQSPLSTSRFGPAYGRLREKLRAARVEAGLSQAQVGHIVGKPQSFVSKIEVGERGVDFIEIQVFARVYGKPLSYFEEKG
jgi:transcriptional regulator with XRE-family HTH domain